MQFVTLGNLLILDLALSGVVKVSGRQLMAMYVLNLFMSFKFGHAAAKYLLHRNYHHGKMN